MRQSLEAAYRLAVEAMMQDALAADAERLEATPVHECASTWARS